ncbi:putative glycosyltransferase HPAT/SRGT1 [Helianthus debilis subsp. tardiflorus]
MISESLHKTEEVRADTAHYGKNITGDIYESVWISEMYGYSFGAAEIIFFTNHEL